MYFITEIIRYVIYVHVLNLIISVWLFCIQFSFLETFVHLSSGSILEDQVDFGVVVKVSEETQNMRVSEQRRGQLDIFTYRIPCFKALPKMGLDLDFSPELVLNLRLHQLGFEEDFQSNNIFALLLAC